MNVKHNFLIFLTGETALKSNKPIATLKFSLVALRFGSYFDFLETLI